MNEDPAEIFYRSLMDGLNRAEKEAQAKRAEDYRRMWPVERFLHMPLVRQIEYILLAYLAVGFTAMAFTAALFIGSIRSQ